MFTQQEDPQISSQQAPRSIAQWHAALAEIAQLVSAPTRREDVTIAAAVGRVLAEPLHLAAEDCAGGSLGHLVLAAGTLIRWTHLPLLVAAGCRTVGVHARVRAGIVTVADRPAGAPPRCAADEATAALIGAIFERLGGQPFATSNPEPGHRLRAVLEMFASRCELIFVVGDPGPLALQAFSAGGSQGGLPCFRVGATLVLLLSPQLQAALIAFVAFAVPLIRRLQGRADSLPPTRLAFSHQAAPQRLAGASMALVSERFDGERYTVAASDRSLGPAGLAGATGIAWRPEELEQDAHEGSLVYLPFEDWLC